MSCFKRIKSKDKNISGWSENSQLLLKIGVTLS